MPTTKFTPSPEQQKVIDHRGGHLQVIACAGAGKTAAISRRVVAPIERRCLFLRSVVRSQSATITR